MARAYSNDLRRKFLQAYDEGEGTLEELAEQFRVSLGWAKKDFRPPVAYRRSGCSSVAAWACEPGYPGGAGVDPKANPRATGCDPAGAAPAIGRGSACALKCGADVVGSAPARAGT